MAAYVERDVDAVVGRVTRHADYRQSVRAGLFRLDGTDLREGEGRLFLKPAD